MEIKKIGVLGAGTMGAGIAQVCAQAGYEVKLIDIDQKFVDRGLGTITKNLSKNVEKGKMAAEEKDAILGRLTGAVGNANLSDVDVVIEAILEIIDVKRKVMAELDGICPAHTILCTNTSSLSISEIAAATNRPDKIVGVHFFNPVPMMKLIEIIPGIMTAPETTDAVVELSKKLGKTPIPVKEYPGFVVNRILIPYINEAVFCLQEGLAPAEDIDAAMKLGANMPMGPLALADLVGNDICLAIMEVFYREFADSKYRPAPLLKQMVRAGLLGMKSGKGFFDYSKK
ncbi:MAG: 3-hydroxybutyryl-CoA dehydrogenase [Firmicutes bacterium]|nr:3-hydroxybutyryl-CoA dehydrogenase [Bacillota bacterium]